MFYSAEAKFRLDYNKILARPGDHFPVQGRSTALQSSGTCLERLAVYESEQNDKLRKLADIQLS